MTSATTKPGMLLTSQLLRAQTHYTVHENYTGCQKGLITFKQWEKIQQLLHTFSGDN